MLQFGDAHLLRLKNDVLAVVQLPVVGQNASGSSQFLVQRSSGKRRDDGVPRQIDARLDRELGRLQKNVGRIVVEPEDEACLQRDPSPVQLLDDLRILVRAVERLVRLAQARRRDRFQTHQQAAAAAARGQIQQFDIVAQQRGRQTVPAQPEWDQRFEQLGRVGLVGDQIQIDEDRFPRPLAADVFHDLLDRLLQRPTPPSGRHNAERTVVDTAASRLEHVRGEEFPARQHAAVGKRRTGQLERRGLDVPRLQAAGGPVAEQPRPFLFGIPDHDAVGMGLCIVRHEGHMGTAQHDADPAAAEMTRQLVRAPGRAGDHRHAYDVGLKIQVDIGDPLVDADDVRVQLGRHEGCQRRQRQRHVPQRLAENSAPMTVQRPLRRDERDM